MLGETPLGSLQRWELEYHSSSVLLFVDTKDLRALAFKFDKIKHSDEELQALVQLLKQRALPTDMMHVFAYSYKEAAMASEDGWNMYQLEREMARQGVVLGKTPVPPAAPGAPSVTSHSWRICELNESFEFAPSYPQRFVVPVSVEDKDVMKIKSFRSKGRIPALCYWHRPRGTAMLRASQPLVGLTWGRSVEDEKLAAAVGIRVIIDARPKRNAVANQAKGGGYEQIDNYTNCRIEFVNIENIHVMRDSLQRVLQLCRQNMVEASEDWYSQLVATSWLKHVRCVMMGVVATAHCLERERVSVLVHCSDGWDRTAQLTSLTQLLLDPYYRTLQGFAVLVQKEWLSFGHKFNHRCGHLKQRSENERSPIFIQFLDCVWQLQQQYSCSFEFNEDFLSFLADHLYSCLFGTFLHNCEKERVETKASTNTVSVWTAAQRRSKFVNPFYRPNPNVLVPNTDPRCFNLWPYYYRWDRRFVPNESVEDRAREMKQLTQSSSETRVRWLEDKMQDCMSEIERLRKHCADLESVLEISPASSSSSSSASSLRLTASSIALPTSPSAQPPAHFRQESIPPPPPPELLPEPPVVASWAIRSPLVAAAPAAAAAAALDDDDDDDDADHDMMDGSDSDHAAAAHGVPPPPPPPPEHEQKAAPAAIAASPVLAGRTHASLGASRPRVFVPDRVSEEDLPPPPPPPPTD